MWSENMRWRDGLFSLCLIGLFILRFPVVILTGYKLLPISREAGMAVFEIGTYFLTVIIILIKRDSLEKYYIDRFALGLLVFAPLGCFVSQSILQRGWNELPFSTYVNGGLALLLGIFLLLWRPVIPAKGRKAVWKWVGIAILTGIAYSVGTGYMLHTQQPLPQTVKMYFPQQAMKALLLIFVQLSNAAALEEPLFRGFLWGELRERGWKEVYIWLFQAFLFTLGHIYYLGSANVSFFFVVPVGALILGLIAWKSQSIGTSMLVHGISNSLGGNLFRFLSW